MFRKIKDWYKGINHEAVLDAREQQMLDPNLFTPKQREFLKDLFPTAWTHFSNFTQEELMRICVTLNMFGLWIDTEEKVSGAIDLLVRQQIVTYKEDNPYLLRRL